MANSWVDVDPESHFPIQNLPLGVGSPAGESPELLIRIGDYAVRCERLREKRLLHELYTFPLKDVTGSLPRLRSNISDLLEVGNRALRDHPQLDEMVVPVNKLQMRMPCHIPAFVDFYSGIHHASNVGRMFRPDMPPLLPNYRSLPVAYNGRASTVSVSPSRIVRPNGQFKLTSAEYPEFGPTRELDYELELGFFVSQGNGPNQPIRVSEAGGYMLGLVLVNDWSARDVQRWEYQPLGPFLAKSFATTISPWVVPFEALEPFRVPLVQDPPPLPHLAGSEVAVYDIELEVSIQSKRMTRPQVISRSNAKHLYWSFEQQLAHVTSNGTSIERGDLYASGTISGPEPGSYGSLLETTWRGTQPLTLEETGEIRTFLEDGDTVRFSGYAQGDGYRIGFGELVGEVLE